MLHSIRFVPQVAPRLQPKGVGARPVRHRVGWPPRAAADLSADVPLTLEGVQGSWNGPLRYFFSFTLPAANFVALYSDVLSCSLHSYFQGSVVAWRTALSFSGLIFPFVVLPLLDLIFGRDTSDPPREAASNEWYRLPVYLYVPLHLSLIFCCCRRASYLLTCPTQFLGVVLGVGVCGGLGFTVAHELIHGTKKLEAFLVDVLLCLFCYMHYAQSHIAHHMKVGTVDDAGTGRFNESYYTFLPRAVFMSVRDGIWMERNRLLSHKKRLLSVHNKMWVWLLSPIALYTCICHYFGRAALLFMCVQAAVAIMTLEVVNYIEHYGLTRKTIDGKLEPVAAKHSWNADWAFTSALVFQLQRHAHHHVQSKMPYQGLRSLPDAPMLPMSYPGLMIAALVPPLYFRLMNPLVQEHQTVR